MAAAGVVSGIFGVALSIFLALTANSVALWADVVATVLDFLAVFIAWRGLKKSELGRTEIFNYGFGRFESLISLAMAGIMITSFFCISGAALIRFQNPVPVHGIGILSGIVVHLVFGFINGRLFLGSLRLERRVKTALVTAQRHLYTIKIVANGLMFCSLTISYFFSNYAWAEYADPVAAIIIACNLVMGASKMFRFSVRDLLDCAIEEQSQLMILKALALHFDQFEQIADIRTRCSGGKIYVEIFLEFSHELSHGAILNTIRSLQKEIKSHIRCDEVLIISALPPSQTAT